MCVVLCKGWYFYGAYCFLGLQSAGARGKKSVEAQPLECTYKSTYAIVFGAPPKAIDGYPGIEVPGCPR